MIHAYNRRRNSIRRVCIFHNDGNCLCVFPDTWQAAYDFLKAESKEAFMLPRTGSDGLPAHTTSWGEGFKEKVGYIYLGMKGGVATISLGNETWGLNNLDIHPNCSLGIMYVKGEPCFYRFS